MKFTKLNSIYFPRLIVFLFSFFIVPLSYETIDYDTNHHQQNEIIYLKNFDSQYEVSITFQGQCMCCNKTFYFLIMDTSRNPTYSSRKYRNPVNHCFFFLDNHVNIIILIISNLFIMVNNVLVRYGTVPYRMISDD